MYLPNWLTEENRPYMLKQTYYSEWHFKVTISAALLLHHLWCLWSKIGDTKPGADKYNRNACCPGFDCVAIYFCYDSCKAVYLERFCTKLLYYTIKLIKRIMNCKHCKLTSVILASQKLFNARDHWHPTTHHGAFRLRWLISSGPFKEFVL